MRIPPRQVRIASILDICACAAALAACQGDDAPLPTRERPTAVPTTIFVAPTDREAVRSALPELGARASAFEAALRSSPPVVPLPPAMLDAGQALAQSIALADARFVELAWSVPDHLPLRNEIVEVRRLDAAEATRAQQGCRDEACFDVVLYNHAENTTTVALVDVHRETVLDVSHQIEMQPQANAHLAALAWKIALTSPAVLSELGIGSAEEVTDAERVLKPSACEQSRHFCVAPALVVAARALWIIVDLTDGAVVAMRWTDADAVKGAPPTESMLRGERIDALLCRQATTFDRNGWRVTYVLTRSDGLELKEVSYRGRPALRSAKVVDWHVSYSREAGFGYSDAVGCPFFSSAAVVAADPPSVEPIEADGEAIGFAVVQDYVHPLWPAACMYNYRQHYQFYDDGTFRITVASNGGGCGNDGTYRPVLRIVPAGDAPTFAEWRGGVWEEWAREAWQLDDESASRTPDGFRYRIGETASSGHYVETGRGQFGDGGRGDDAYVFVTAHRPEEGDDDLFTIGPCCNADYRQGPEKYIEPVPEDLSGRDIVLWYVPQLKNDDAPGSEYCWATSTVADGMYTTRAWPCYAGPRFVPFDE